MARRRLELGEVATIHTTKLGEKKWRARAYTRTRDGKRVQVQADGTSKDKATARLREAAKMRAGFRGEGEIGPESKLKDVAEKYIERKVAAGKLSPTSARAYRMDIARNGGANGVTDLRLRECTPAVMRGYLSDLSGESAASAKRLKSLLRRTFEYAASEGADLAVADPIGRVELDAPNKPAPRALTKSEKAEFRALLVERVNADKRRWQLQVTAWDVAIHTGLRPGELLGLRRQDVNLNADVPTLTVSGTVVEGDGGRTYRQAWPKTENSYRTIPITPDAAEALRYAMNKARGEILFPARGNVYMSVSNYGRRLADARSSEYSWVTPHVARRTLATELEREVGPESASAYLGNTVAVLSKHYVEKRASTAPDLTHVIVKNNPTINAEAMSVIDTGS